MKTENICECGHPSIIVLEDLEIDVHTGGDGKCRKDNCPCKKFKPQNQSQDSVSLHTDKKEDRSKTLQPDTRKGQTPPTKVKGGINK